MAMIAGLFLIAAASSAHAASFDCKAARSPLEKAICADATLSKADEAMAAVYRAQLAAAPLEYRTRLRDSQRSWLAYVPRFCSVPAGRTLECLRKGFADRTTELMQTTRQVGGLTFFRASTYVAGLSPTRPDRAFTTRFDFIQLADPRTQAQRRWNVMASEHLTASATPDEEPADDASELEVSVQLGGASRDVVSARFGTYEYEGSMAHGQYQSTALVWSLRLGRELTLDDLLKDDHASMEQLADRVLAHFDGADRVTRADMLEALDGSWEATPAGLLFEFDPYTFGCYVCGGRALVPWAELGPYLRPDLPFVIKDLRD